MGFYNSISSVYDSIFPLNRAQISFLEKEGVPNGKLLDVGCGTGSLAIAMARNGHQVWGIDFDASMVSMACHKVDHGTNPTFSQANMLHLEMLFPLAQFDLIYCLGNTLVHLDGLKTIQDAISQQYKLLAPGGKLVFQVINYNRIFAQGLTALPTIQGDDFTFERLYKYKPESRYIRFESIYTQQADTTRLSNEVTLYALLQEDIETLFVNLGVVDYSFYGSFNHDELTPNSQPLICVATKPSVPSVNL